MDYISCEKMKELEKLGNEAGLTYYNMMENAGAVATKDILKLSEAVPGTTFVIFCGKGNNGGDGLVVARLLSKKAMDVSVILVEGLPQTEDALKNYNLLEGVKIYDEIPSDISADVVIDAIYGTGFHGFPRDNGSKAIRLISKMHHLGSRTIALDIPSGLCGDVRPDEDVTDSLCVCAHETITFHRPKLIHKNKSAQKLLGKTIVADIGIDRALNAAYLVNDRKYAIPYKHNIVAGSKAVCIVLHGYESSMESPTAKMLMSELPKAGISTFCFDFPGHGESFLPMEKLTTEDCVSDLAFVEKYVHDLAPDAAIYYFGSSFGGYTVLRHLGSGDFLGTKAFLRSCAVNMDEIFSQGCNLTEFFRENHEKASGCNVLMMHGTSDEDVPYAKATAFAKEFNIDLVSVEGGDHRLSKEGMPQRVCETAIKFFD